MEELLSTGCAGALSLCTEESARTSLQGFGDNFFFGNLERCDSFSTIDEYMTPEECHLSMESLVADQTETIPLLQGSEHDNMSNIFCSSFEVFPYRELYIMAENNLREPHTGTACSESSQSSTSVSIALDTPPELAVKTMNNASSMLESDQKEESEAPEQTAAILDISEQRVNFINTPSSLSLLSSEITFRENNPKDGYQHLDSNSSMESSSGSSANSNNSTGQYHPQRDTKKLQMPASKLSTTSMSKLVALDPIQIHMLGDKTEKHENKQFYLTSTISWARFKTSFRYRIRAVQGYLKRKAAHMKKENASRSRRFLGTAADSMDSQHREESLDDDRIDIFRTLSYHGQQSARNKPRLVIKGQGDEGIDDISSDEFYTSSKNWDIRKMYQRAVSYFHKLWCH